MTPRPPEFLAVPAGTRPSQCNGPNCKAVIFFAPHPRTGRPHPVDCDVEGGEAPSAVDSAASQKHDGRGVSHFATCADADHFRGKKQ